MAKLALQKLLELLLCKPCLSISFFFFFVLVDETDLFEVVLTYSKLFACACYFFLAVFINLLAFPAWLFLS